MSSFIQGFCGIDSKSVKEEFDEKNPFRFTESSFATLYCDTASGVIFSVRRNFSVGACELTNLFSNAL